METRQGYTDMKNIIYDVRFLSFLAYLLPPALLSAVSYRSRACLGRISGDLFRDIINVVGDERPT